MNSDGDPLRMVADTAERAFAALVDVQRKLSPGQKLNQVLEMAEMWIRATEDQVRREFPDADAREVFLRAASLRLGAEAFVRVYGWVPGKPSALPRAARCRPCWQPWIGWRSYT